MNYVCVLYCGLIVHFLLKQLYSLTDSKRLWRKPDFMNASSPFPSSFLNSARSELLHSSSRTHGRNSQSQHSSFLPFTPMDLSRLPSDRMNSNSLGPRATAEDFYDEERSNDLVISSTSSNSNNSLHNGNGSSNSHNHLPAPLTHPSAAVLNDFVESTMKELLGLHGIS